MGTIEKRKILTIIQARMGSSRLAGKVLYPIVHGKSALRIMIERVSKANTGTVMVASTVNSDDEAIEKECSLLGCDCFRGSEENILDRCYRAALQYNLAPSDVVIRLTADCPMFDKKVANKVIDTFLQLEGAEYVSNTNPPTFPDGLDIEVFTFAILEKMWKNATTDMEKEHTTLYVRKRMDEFVTDNIVYKDNLSKTGWSLDTLDDFKFIQKVFEHLYDDNPDFDMQDILQLVKENPDIEKINKHIPRNTWHDELKESGEIEKDII